MSTFISILVVVLLIMANRSSKKQKKAPRNTADSQYDTYYPEPEKEPVRRVKSTKPTRRINRPKVEPGPAAEEKTAIAKRVEKQHDDYDRSRIHQNVHKEEPDISDETVPMMEKVRDLIVCGYPVEIPGQRDFVKEGEDFLANLGTGNTFF